MPSPVVIVLSKFKVLTEAHPLVKGIVSYAVLWPTGSLIQQTLEGKKFETYDWKRCIRFSMWGSMFVAPTLYAWVRLTSAMWPRTNLRTGLVKAVVEQFSYGPFACASFFYGMTLLEFKTTNEAFAEMQEKFMPTYKVGMCVWPVLQTINFSMVPERNRLVFVSVCSLMWTTFLAYMKQYHDKKNEEEDVQKESNQR